SVLGPSGRHNTQDWAHGHDSAGLSLAIAREHPNSSGPRHQCDPLRIPNPQRVALLGGVASASPTSEWNPTMAEMWNHVVVRDGRLGRDPALVTEKGGEILLELDTDRLYEPGEHITLSDGTEVVIVGDDFYLHEMNEANEIVS